MADRRRDLIRILRTWLMVLAPFAAIAGAYMTYGYANASKLDLRVHPAVRC